MTDTTKAPIIGYYYNIYRFLSCIINDINHVQLLITLTKKITCITKKGKYD